MIIRDPVTGVGMEVDDEKMGHVSAVCASVGHHINHIHKEAYSIIISKTPTGAGDCFLYLKNTADVDLLVTGILLYAASDEFIQIKLKDAGTPANGTANVPVPRNCGSGNTANCTCEDGVDITGLSGGSVVEDIFKDGATDARKYSWSTDIIVTKNGVMTLYAVTGAIAIKATLSICFHT